MNYFCAYKTPPIDQQLFLESPQSNSLKLLLLMAGQINLIIGSVRGEFTLIVYFPNHYHWRVPV